jgi:hypothetical protein
MQSLLALLQALTHDVALHSAIARHNLEAAGTDAGDVAQAMESREAGHREFSIFTPSQGRE